MRGPWARRPSWATWTAQDLPALMPSTTTARTRTKTPSLGDGGCGCFSAAKRVFVDVDRVEAGRSVGFVRRLGGIGGGVGDGWDPVSGWVAPLYHGRLWAVGISCVG